MTNVANRAVNDSVWAQLTTRQRRDASLWLDIVQRMESAGNKAAELSAILSEFAGLKGLSRSGVYRKIAAFERDGVAGLVHASALRRLDNARDTLPADFVTWWQGLCGLNQRRKAAAVWRSLFFDWLIPGKIIPGYKTDWAGIWSAEHPRGSVPAVCPYSPGGQVPRGWSYRNMVA